ncbi:MAG: succinylglutamate desuccinylase/aspartoacylase family protein [Mitsuaria chitosanitabida]|uniref:succinylglutamate desuccinylase/aspartoacylase domain-containing protein n=1 Tax=Roseateles chitosanitabidus TaxID=65048 RepID=UPI001B23A707|nr:succinylglutamate desuccinylase/aspartoacylase family protein [Roseateles chitosanitabidus]MBO9686680.1 succinylglutamate desuccinylase/aspartoacylase family protein [Roseateles chitosanitabidus]
MTATLPSPDSGAAPTSARAAAPGATDTVPAADTELPVSALQLAPPDIERWRDGGSGVPFVHVRDSGRPGPTAMVLALTHGNELCGAIALDWLLSEQVRPTRGRLILAFANIEAFRRFDARAPFATRCVDEDMNRVWADEVLLGPRDSVELRRARVLAPFIDSADALLDLHSMQEAGAPALTICGMTDKSVPLARALGQPETLLVDTGHAAGLRLIDRGGFSDPDSPRKAVLVECGAHWEHASADMAIDVTLRFLLQLGMVETGWATSRLRVAAPARQRLVRVGEGVTARSPRFRFLMPTHHLLIVPRAGTPLAEDDGHQWLTPHDDCVLIMPSRRAGRAGQTMVRLGRYED